MDTKLLYSIAFVFSIIVGAFYYYSGQSEKLVLPNNQDLTSTAEHIQITQTDEDGQLYAKTNIEHMTQWMTNERVELKIIQGNLYDNGQIHAAFNANTATSDNGYQTVQLSGDIVLSKLNPQQQPIITFHTDQLQGDTKTHQIQTDRLVLVTNPQAQFTSQGLNANLSTGQYEFFNIRGKYDPITQ